MADYMVAEQVLGQAITIALVVMVLSELYGVRVVYTPPLEQQMNFLNNILSIQWQ